MNRVEIQADEVVRTDLVQVNGVVLGAQFVESSLGRLAVWAPGFGEDSYNIQQLALVLRRYLSTLDREVLHKLTNRILVDDLLCFGSGGRHGCRVDRGRGKESA